MKQVISKHTNQVPTIDLNDIDFSKNIVAIEAEMLGCEKVKHILTPLKNKHNSHFGFSSGFGFVSGNARWQSEESLEDLMKAVLSDERVKVYVFDDLKLLANWLLT